MTTPTYTIHKIPKKSGGVRIIEAPDDATKARQKEILASMKFLVSPFAHGFLPYKNVATMAAPHVGKDWILHMDIHDFFPSIKYNMFFHHARYTGDHPSREFSRVCFHDFDDGKGLRLPQGAATSPMLSNAYLATFDYVIGKIAYLLDVVYTRYADDMVLSGSDKDKLWVVYYRIVEELKARWLKLNEKKTSLTYKTHRQVVCGVVVNQKLNIRKKYRRNLRAQIHQHGMTREAKGKLAYVSMVRDCNKESYTNIDYYAAQKLCKVLEGNKA